MNANADYSEFYNLKGDNFNIEAVCPYYLPESQCTFTWYRDERGRGIVSGYDPEEDESAHWLCGCGRFITNGCCHCVCGAESPWGCDCGALDEFDEDLDFGFEFDPYEGLNPELEWDRLKEDETAGGLLLED